MTWIVGRMMVLGGPFARANEKALDGAGASRKTALDGCGGRICANLDLFHCHRHDVDFGSCRKAERPPLHSGTTKRSHFIRPETSLVPPAIRSEPQIELPTSYNRAFGSRDSH